MSAVGADFEIVVSPDGAPAVAGLNGTTHAARPAACDLKIVCLSEIEAGRVVLPAEV
jgi:hypothetical protein